MELERKYAELLIRSSCLKNYSSSEKGNITTTNGDIVPLYLSCRTVLSQPKERIELEQGLINLASKDYPYYITVTGLATAGISWAHSIASYLNYPLLYIREKKKEYGLGGFVEGLSDNYSCNNNVVIVDDVVYSGESIVKAINILKNYNFNVNGVLCIAKLGDSINHILEENRIKLSYLTEYETLLEMAYENAIINKNEQEFMRKLYKSR